MIKYMLHKYPCSWADFGTYSVFSRLKQKTSPTSYLLHHRHHRLLPLISLPLLHFLKPTPPLTPSLLETFVWRLLPLITTTTSCKSRSSGSGRITVSVRGAISHFDIWKMNCSQHKQGIFREVFIKHPRALNLIQDNSQNNTALTLQH